MAKVANESKDSLVKKAGYLTIIAHDLADSMKNGNFKSLYHGQGIEFNGVRDYIRGDDVRSIDWNVTARMNKPYVKVFDEEKELQTFIIVDSSESMQLSVEKRSKYGAAAEAAALITIASELNECPVGAVFFDGSIHFSSKPKSGRKQTMLLLNHLDKLPLEKVKGSILSNAITGAAKLLKQRSLVFVFSDFRAADWEKPLLLLAQKNDVIAVRLHDKFDDELPAIGSAIFEDVESGTKMMLPTSTPKFIKQWNDFHEKQSKQWSEFCKKHGITPVVLKTVDEPLHVLLSVFAKKAQG